MLTDTTVDMAKINDSDTKKIKALIIKVKALADKSEGGEKENAKRKLTELLLKYNITKFEENKYKKRTFKLADFNDCKTIMIHCVIDTNKNASIEGYKAKKELYCKLTDEEYVEVCEKFNHYYPIFNRQRENFVKAFILKNDLGIAESTNSVENTEDEGLAEISDFFKNIECNKLIKHSHLLNEN